MVDGVCYGAFLLNDLLLIKIIETEKIISNNKNGLLKSTSDLLLDDYEILQTALVRGLWAGVFHDLD